MSNTTVVEVEMMMRLATRDPAVVVPARFRYDPADPYAVSATFHTEPDSETGTWTFARELLATGLDQPAGLGVVRVCPFPGIACHSEQVTAALSSTNDDAVLEVPVRRGSGPVAAPTPHMPRGQEARHQDLDAVLARCSTA
jgi:hypothetical protein